VTDPCDDLPIGVRRANWGWFGTEPWPSGVCYDDDDNLRADMHKPFPAGESCVLCGEQFSEEAGDSGKAMPSPEGIRHVHKECMVMNVVGSLAHHEGHCRCHGEDGRMPGMTLRQEALEVWRRMLAGELFR
jgi:hypothetical protein